VVIAGSAAEAAAEIAVRAAVGAAGAVEIAAGTEAENPRGWDKPKGQSSPTSYQQAIC